MASAVTRRPAAEWDWSIIGVVGFIVLSICGSWVSQKSRFRVSVMGQSGFMARSVGDLGLSEEGVEPRGCCCGALGVVAAGRRSFGSGFGIREWCGRRKAFT